MPTSQTDDYVLSSMPPIVWIDRALLTRTDLTLNELRVYLQTIYVAATQDTNWEAHERACFAATYPTARTDTWHRLYLQALDGLVSKGLLAINPDNGKHQIL